MAEKREIIKVYTGKRSRKDIIYQIILAYLLKRRPKG